MEAGRTQAILKYESEAADEAFDENGVVTPIRKESEEAVSLFLERGLTDRITLQGKLGWTRGQGLFDEFQGRGPLELGARYVVFRSPRTVISVYAGGQIAGESLDAPGRAGKPGVEVRLLAGRSGELWRHHLFAEVQLARLTVAGWPDETRVETTLGFEPRRRWLVLAQSYAGRQDAAPVAPLWVKSEWSVLHDIGRWRMQAGWRASQLGIETPVSRGPVLALWRTF